MWNKAPLTTEEMEDFTRIKSAFTEVFDDPDEETWRFVRDQIVKSGYVLDRWLRDSDTVLERLKLDRQQFYVALDRLQEVADLFFREKAFREGDNG